VHRACDLQSIPVRLVFAGGVLQTLLLVLVWPLQGFSAERRVLASAYRALADYAANITVDELVAPDPNTFATLKATLADPQPFARRGESVAFEVLLDEAERIRGMLGALTIDRYTLTTDGRVEEAATVATLGITVQSVLAEIAAALAGDRVPQDDGKWRTLRRRPGARRQMRKHCSASSALRGVPRRLRSAEHRRIRSRGGLRVCLPRPSPKRSRRFAQTAASNPNSRSTRFV